MNFNEQLNAYMQELHCTAKEVSARAGLSPATLSRYRSGERVPEPNSDAFGRICAALAALAAEQGAPHTESTIAERFLACPDVIASDKEQFRRKLNTLISALGLTVAQLCQYTNYESSALFRIRSGSRNPSDPAKFAADVADLAARAAVTEQQRGALQSLLTCPPETLDDAAQLSALVRDWLMAGQAAAEGDMDRFLAKLDEFDLNEYIKAIRFDELKVPTVPFQLPTSRVYTGLREMMDGELDFLKAAVLSKSMEDVIMYSDMPMEEMAKDPEFPKKWMFGMAMMLKKGLHLHMIHNLDRPFNEMMLGLEGWVPMYMTGQVSPYYLKNPQNDVFLHFLKVSGTAALSGEAIAGHHAEGRYYLTKSRDEVAYYKKRAQALLSHARPLMEIYRAENAEQLRAFLRTDAAVPGRRRSVLPAPPLYTMDTALLEQILTRNAVSPGQREAILTHAAQQRQWVETLLAHSPVTDEISSIPPEECQRYPLVLPLSGLFCEQDIPYTYEEYQAHLRQTDAFAETHPGYTVRRTAAYTFRNLQLFLHEGQWAMVSKNKSPAIHFVIRHPKLRSAMEKFVPPIMEG